MTSFFFVHWQIRTFRRRQKEGRKREKNEGGRAWVPNAERSFGFRLSLRSKIIFGYMVALAYSTVHRAPALYCTRRARARWESRPETSYGGVRPQGPHCAGICLGICWHVDGCEGVLPLIWRGDKHRRVGGFIPIRPLLYRCLSRAGAYPRARNPVTVFRSL
jgi:hypothetical protein